MWPKSSYTNVSAWKPVKRSGVGPNRVFWRFYGAQAVRLSMKNQLGNIPFHLMRQLLQEHTARWQRSLPELTKQQFSVLCAVADKPGIEQLELMDEALMTKATLAELLVRMEKKALLIRTPGETDKRRRLITLTAQGRAVLEQARPLAAAVDATFLSRLNSGQQQQLITLLQSLLAEQ